MSRRNIAAPTAAAIVSTRNAALKPTRCARKPVTSGPAIAPAASAARDALELNPRIHPSWQSLELRLCFRGARLRVRVDADELTVWSDRPTPVRVGGGETNVVGDGDGWRVAL